MRSAVWSEEISADFTQSSIRVTLRMWKFWITTGVYQSRTDLYTGGNVSQQCCDENVPAPSENWVFLPRYRTKDQTILVNTFDTPLLYMGRWNPTQSFCAITKRRIINGRFTAGLWITHGNKLQDTCPDSVSSVMEWRLWSREPQRKIWKACQIMTRVWLPLFAGNHCSAVLRRCQAMRPWLSGGSMKNSRRWKKTAGSMTIRRKSQTFRCFFVKNENRRKSTALILRCYVT